jgi:ankyrin repeat protein
MPSKATPSWNKAAKKALKKPVVKLTAEKASQKRTLEALMNLDLCTPPALRSTAAKPAPKKATAPPAGEELIRAAYNNDTALARQLLEAGADVNAQEGNGWTALQHAVDQDNEALTRLLLDHGAELNRRNIPTGRAAIHYAAMGDDDNLLRLLIERGADIEVRNNDGETPLYDAVSSGKEACVKLLIDSGADVTAKTLAGKGVIFAAAEGKHGDIAELLMTYPAQSQARREALEAQQKASGEALAAQQTVLQERVSVNRPLVLKSPLK